jgi:hypothetical protein
MVAPMKIAVAALLLAASLAGTARADAWRGRGVHPGPAMR